MIAVVVVVAAFAAADPSASAPVLDVLRGIDSLPAPAALRSTSTSVLQAVALDEAQQPRHRARALRLIGVRDDVDPLVFATLRQSATRELRVQAALAEGDHARRRGQLLSFARTLLRSDDVDMRSAAVTLLAREKTVGARAVLAAHVDVDVGVAQQVRGRLRRWPARP